MADPIQKAKDAARPVAHPADTARDLAAEAHRGQSERTPVLALTGVTVVVGSVVAVLVAAALLVYYLV